MNYSVNQKKKQMKWVSLPHTGTTPTRSEERRREGARSDERQTRRQRCNMRYLLASSLFPSRRRDQRAGNENTMTKTKMSRTTFRCDCHANGRRRRLLIHTTIWRFQGFITTTNDAYDAKKDHSSRHIHGNGNPRMNRLLLSSSIRNRRIQRILSSCSHFSCLTH